MRVLLAVAAFFVAAPSLAQPVRATRILVDKSEHRMYVFAGTELVATYPAGFGVNRIGHKQEEGDRRTPEGKYVLDSKNANSAFFRSIHISYPNAADRAAARRRGVSPGGAIMVHGQPNDPELAKRVPAYPFPDWTDGCIALSNASMAALWEMVHGPVPIEITP
ncbi:L,D-transpeptidase family protein [Cognatilysobacter terrigena]|uniref:L,D-transpeptidase family protein n=1 Tax=Cognatilysobacter terrigena TaxID=2488749 RepID=UPI001060B1AD|nr:L,D-transpeptidase family protein [Lysobacter terrigena]